jgi:hypothetical protein
MISTWINAHAAADSRHQSQDVSVMQFRRPVRHTPVHQHHEMNIGWQAQPLHSLADSLHILELGAIRDVLTQRSRDLNTDNHARSSIRSE